MEEINIENGCPPHELKKSELSNANGVYYRCDKCRRLFELLSPTRLQSMFGGREKFVEVEVVESKKNKGGK